MKVEPAKEQVLDLIRKDLSPDHLDRLDPEPTANDPGKFHLDGQPARVVQPFNGFYANINLDWFDGSTEPPEIQRESFHWYVFALDTDQDQAIEDYYVADYHTVREFVLDFDAPQGNDHQDHHDWRGRIDKLDDDTGLFVWGDEDPDNLGNDRRIRLHNLPEALTDEAGSSPTTPPTEYEDFGQAPEDDPDELQEFARRVRKGQPKFRKALVSLYDGRCAVTGHGPSEALEACHIENHSRTGRNDPDNGLLLRADIHYLFDEGLLTIDPDSYVIRLDERLKDTPYWQYHGTKLRRRTDSGFPEADALRERQGD